MNDCFLADSGTSTSSTSYSCNQPEADTQKITTELTFNLR
jgi:hypothetical protein